MSFFNFRRSESSALNAGSAAPPESAELIRKRAKHRLIGSAVLVLVGVLGFPLLFDTQPRPVTVEIPIEIPSRSVAKALAVVPPVPAAKVASAEKVGVDAGLSEKEEIIQQKPIEAQSPRAQGAIKNEAKALPKIEAKIEPKPAAPEPKALAKPVTPALAGNPGKAPAVEPRLVVQVGAFSDADKARDARIKLEKAGLKPHTQVADTKDGKRIRVRVGPFDTRAEADRAASKIKSLDMPAAILSL